MSPPSSARQALKHRIRSGRVVVKIGSSVLTDKDGHLEPKTIRRLAMDIAPIVGLRRWPFIVSSGAIAVGVGILGLKQRPKTMAGLQAAAALGQSKLVETWSQAFRKLDVPVAQVLLTHSDLADRRRFLNARRALAELERRRAICVINENDTVSFEEIAFGDNDELAAHVCNVVDATLLIMLSVAGGVMNEQGDRIKEVLATDEGLDALVRPTSSKFGRGGMGSKLNAARVACAAGAYVAILPGRTPRIIERFLDGEDVGTLLIPEDGPLKSRRHWIAHALRPAGTLVVDAGAARALREHKKSLLAAGVVKVMGDFDEGDPVDIAEAPADTQRVFARGLCRYSAAQMHQILGHPSEAITRILGFSAGNALVHRDDLVILET